MQKGLTCFSLPRLHLNAACVPNSCRSSSPPTLTSAPTWSPWVTAWPPAPTCGWRPDAAPASWPSEGGESRRGRRDGSCLTWTTGGWPTILVSLELRCFLGMTVLTAFFFVLFFFCVAARVVSLFCHLGLYAFQDVFLLCCRLWREEAEGSHLLPGHRGSLLRPSANSHFSELQDAAGARRSIRELDQHQTDYSSFTLWSETNIFA